MCSLTPPQSCLSSEMHESKCESALLNVVVAFFFVFLSFSFTRWNNTCSKKEARKAAHEMPDDPHGDEAIRWCLGGSWGEGGRGLDPPLTLPTRCCISALLQTAALSDGLTGRGDKGGPRSWGLGGGCRMKRAEGLRV